MIEFAVAIGLLVGLVSTRKLWNKWLKFQADSVSIWVKDSEVDLQDKIAEVKKLQDEAITRNGKWLSLKDLER